MSSSVRSAWWSAGLSLLAFLIIAPIRASAQTGSVTVKVTDARTSAPVDQAQISIVGTTLGGLTNQEGDATVRNVPAGIRVVRVIRVGFVEQKKSLNVSAGQQASVTFALQQIPLTLAPVVTTATGEVRRVELGNSVSSVDAASKVSTTPINSMGDLLVAKAPGGTGAAVEHDGRR